MPKVRQDIKSLSDYKQQKTYKDKYPWLESLMDGRTHELVKGKDFQTATETMRSSINIWAKRKGHKVTVRVEKGNVLVQKPLAKPKARKPTRKR